MTNNEKFYETFGMRLKDHVDFCDICETTSSCMKCPLYGYSFEYDKYKDPNKTFKNVNQTFLEALAKENDVVIALAYSYAKNFDKYGVDITALWDNMAKNEQVLGIAYAKGYYDALLQTEDDKNRGGYEGKWIPTSEAMPTKTDFYLIQYSRKYCHDELAVAYYSVEEKRSDPDYEWEFRPMEHEYEEVVAWRPLPKMYHTGREDKE